MSYNKVYCQCELPTYNQICHDWICSIKPVRVARVTTIIRISTEWKLLLKEYVG